MSDETRRGCGDSNCEVAKPRGMATQGGCRCSEQEVRRELRRVRRELQRLESDPVTQAAVRLAEAVSQFDDTIPCEHERTFCCAVCFEERADRYHAALPAYRTAKAASEAAAKGGK